MATQVIKLKRSATPGKVPSTADLALGEIAINTHDGKIYLKKDNGTERIVEIGSGGRAAIKVLDDISSQFDGTDTTFTLTYNSEAYAPEFLNSVVVSVGGVLQVPTDAYSISGSTITFTGAPPTGVSFYALSFEFGATSITGTLAASDGGTGLSTYSQGDALVGTSNGELETTSNSTGAIIIPVGTTEQRPSSPVVGMLRFNSETNEFEGYNGTEWKSLTEDFGSSFGVIDLNEQLDW